MSNNTERKAVKRALEIVNAVEWSGNLEVNMTTALGAGRVLAKRLAIVESELSTAKAEVERLRMYREIAEALISAFLSTNEVVLAHFDENDQLRGNGQWRLKEIAKAAKRADHANRKAARALDAAAGQECDE